MSCGIRSVSFRPKQVCFQVFSKVSFLENDYPSTQEFNVMLSLMIRWPRFLQRTWELTNHSTLHGQWKFLSYVCKHKLWFLSESSAFFVKSLIICHNSAIMIIYSGKHHVWHSSKYLGHVCRWEGLFLPFQGTSGLHWGVYRQPFTLPVWNHRET